MQKQETKKPIYNNKKDFFNDFTKNIMSFENDIYMLAHIENCFPNQHLDILYKIGTYNDKTKEIFLVDLVTENNNSFTKLIRDFKTPSKLWRETHKGDYYRELIDYYTYFELNEITRRYCNEFLNYYIGIKNSNINFYTLPYHIPQNISYCYGILSQEECWPYIKTALNFYREEIKEILFKTLPELKQPAKLYDVYFINKEELEIYKREHKKYLGYNVDLIPKYEDAIDYENLTFKTFEQISNELKKPKEKEYIINQYEQKIYPQEFFDNFEKEQKRKTAS